MALTGTLVDNFDDNSTDAQWIVGNVFGDSTAGMTVAEQNQRLEIALAVSSAGFHSSGYKSATTYDLTDSYVYVKQVQKHSGDSGAYASLILFVDTNNWMRIQTFANLLNVNSKTAGSFTEHLSTAYSATTDVWFRIRNDSGTGRVHFETAGSSAANSPDSGDWTSRFDFATPFAITALTAGIDAGTEASIAAPGTVIFDGFNVRTTPATIIPAAGSYSLTGAGLTFKTDRKVYPAAGSLALTGAGVGLRTDRVLQAASASFVIAGSVGFKADRVLFPASGDFALNGSASFKADRQIQPAAGTFDLTGAGVGLKADRALNAASAGFDLLGAGVDFATTSPQHYTIDCASAEFLVAANDVGLSYAPVVTSTRPTGGPPGKRIRFRGRYYDSVKDRQYLSRALQEFVEERIEPPPEPKSRKQRKRSKTTAKVSNFTPQEVVEVEAVISVIADREQKLAEYVADLLMMMEEEEFLLMAA